jgi:hypothetical protein
MQGGGATSAIAELACWVSTGGHRVAVAKPSQTFARATTVVPALSLERKHEALSNMNWTTAPQAKMRRSRCFTRPAELATVASRRNGRAKVSSWPWGVGHMKTALARFGVCIPFKAIFGSMTSGT